jgi:hypothetical protein
VDGPPGYEEFDRLCRQLDKRRTPESAGLMGRLEWRWRVRKQRSARHVIDHHGFHLVPCEGTKRPPAKAGGFEEQLKVDYCG